MTTEKGREPNQCLTRGSLMSTAAEALDRTNKFPQLSLPLAQSSACDVCGRPFEVVRRRGRPQRFCSDACRAAQLKAQKSDWSRVHWASRSTAKRNLSTSTGETPDVEF